MKEADILNIFVAESHPCNTDTIKQATAGFGTVFWALPGQDALETLGQVTPDLIIVGSNPGAMTACERAESIRDHDAYAHIPMLLTGDLSDGNLYEFRGYDKGPVDYLGHPFNTRALTAKIRFFSEMALKEKRLSAISASREDALASLDREKRLRKRTVEALARSINKHRNLSRANRNIEFQLQQAQKMEAVGTLAGGIAHDFNNILAAIMGYVELAQFDATENSSVRYSLDQVLKASHRARKLVSHILTFSRQADAEKKPVYIQDIITECVELLRATIPSTVAIQHAVCAERKAVEADSTQIHQVVMNLCTNAYHAMNERGGRIFITLDHVVKSAESSRFCPELKSGGYMKLTVSDTGCGMDEGTLRKIFDPYFTTKEKGRGTGMGLSVVHGIVKSHGGGIDVLSEAGKGSRFTLYFPVAEVCDADFGMDIPEVFPRGGGQVLFVDDEGPLVDIGTKVLERLGYRVIASTSSPKAFDLFRSNPEAFDIVITDMTMPDMTGLQLARKIKCLAPHIPVVLCTGYHKEINTARIKEYGVDHLMLKPLKMIDLAMMMREAIQPRMEAGLLNHG